MMNQDYKKLESALVIPLFTHVLNGHGKRSKYSILNTLNNLVILNIIL